jgi:colanic acid/amylovoran biosynthesis glycosyltransferase
MSRELPRGISKLDSTTLTILKKRTYDIIHCQDGPAGLRTLALRRVGLLQGKLITSFRGRDATKDPTGSKSRMYDELFQQGDLFLPVSHFLKIRLIELGCNEKKIRVYRSAIDCKKFCCVTRTLDGVDEVRLVTTARLVAKKGLEYAIRAVARLAAQRRNVRYDIVGDGVMRQELERLIEELHLKDVVRLVGWKTHEELIDILARSHIYVSPSVTAEDGDQEGIPNALKEAMAICLPAIATAHAGIPELITDGVSGFLVPERDIEALVGKMRYLIDNPEVWAEIGKAARAVVEEYYDINRLSDELVDNYQELLEMSTSHLSMDAKCSVSELVS